MLDDVMSSMKTIESYAAILKDSVTAAAILIGGLWAIFKFQVFRQYRQAEEFVKIEIQSQHVWLPERLALYVTAEVENIGVAEIRFYLASLRVRWLVGEAQYLEEVNKDISCDSSSTDYVIDKGERGTFAFAWEAPLTPGGTEPTACWLRLQIQSERLLKNGKHLSWAREQMYVLSK